MEAAAFLNLIINYHEWLLDLFFAQDISINSQLMSKSDNCRFEILTTFIYFEIDYINFN